MWAVPRLCEFYPGICLTTEEKAWKNLSQGKKNLRLIKPSDSVQYTYYQNTHYYYYYYYYSMEQSPS